MTNKASAGKLMEKLHKWLGRTLHAESQDDNLRINGRLQPILSPALSLVP
jgi:hypothetical protein